MAEVVGAVFEFCWEFGIERAYRRWGWFGGVAAFLAPFLTAAGIIAIALNV
ncbi:hypothetical protein [Sphingomonas azotifigens]|uniref:hypothetical protein n=1 Tax=Sphingomonas azotifigens TaxID=330920 RepID=UPI0014316D45|nr:hypothetical protein [Sphingomonas azotifigens]